MTATRILRLTATLAFVLAFVALVYQQKSDAARVLVLHSYNTDYAWVTQINEGVARALDPRADVLQLHHYMDLKNHTDEAFRRTASSLAHRVIDEWQPDVLILFDDVAQQLVGSDYATGPGDDPPFAIVFGGVNGVPETYYGAAANVAGILERKALDAIRDTLMQLVIAQQPGADLTELAPRIQYIGDRSQSITAEIPFYDTMDWAPLVWRDPVQVDTFEDWKDAVRRAGDEADLILLTNYQQVRNGRSGTFVRPAAQVMQWTEANATVPVLGVGWSNSQDGAMLTVSVSPFEQGEISGDLALAIIDGTPPAQLGVIEPRQFMIHICAPSMARRNVALPQFYEAFARATDNYIETGC